MEILKILVDIQRAQEDLKIAQQVRSRPGPMDDVTLWTADTIIINTAKKD